MGGVAMEKAVTVKVRGAVAREMVEAVRVRVVRVEATEVAVAAMGVAKRLGAGMTASIITVEQRRKKGPQRGVAGP